MMVTLLASTFHSTACHLRRRQRVSWEQNLVYRNHSSFGRTLKLSELLDDIAIWRIVEKHCSHNSSGSSILFNRLDAYGGLVRPEQPYEMSHNDGRPV